VKGDAKMIPQMYIMAYRAHLVDKRGVGALHISWFAWRQGKTRRSTIPGLQNSNSEVPRYDLTVRAHLAKLVAMSLFCLFAIRP
jgi:hypothetical protein